MTSIAAFEWASCGGLYVDKLTPGDCPFLDEGRAMLEALRAAGKRTPPPFEELPRLQWQVHSRPDSRLALATQAARTVAPPIESAEQLFDAWLEVAAAADATILVLPECDALLEQAVQYFDAKDIRLINCHAELITMASDKWATSEFCRRHQLAHPPTFLARGDSWPETTQSKLQVLKPRYGAGGDGISLLPATSAAPKEFVSDTPDEGGFIVQPWVLGTAYSCSAIVDVNQRWHWLPPVLQHLALENAGPNVVLEAMDSQKQTIKYVGGKVVPALSDDKRLANLRQALQDAVESEFPRQTLGWFSVDLVHSGGEWHVIELNPRCTTSLIGLNESSTGEVVTSLLNAAFAPLDTSWTSRVKWREAEFSI